MCIRLVKATPGHDLPARGSSGRRVPSFGRIGDVIWAEVALRCGRKEVRPDLARGATLRGGRRARLGEYQRDDELLGEPPPFGGHAETSSGVGRVGGGQVFEAFTERKTVVLAVD
jgi:hypothetical protein